jgi:hypothetical protein
MHVLRSSISIAVTGVALFATSAWAAPSPPEEVWAPVERRNQSWVEGKRDEYLAIHHPDYLRWHLNQPRLDTKADVVAFWDRLHRNETSFSIKVMPERLQFLADGKVAIAHYTVEEVVRIEPSDGPKSQKQPETVRFRFSDVYERRNGAWLYVGGHRDWSSLPNRGRVQSSSKAR